jgi:hypothetical protein
MRESAPIGFREHLEFHSLELSAKFPDDRPKGRQIDLFEVGSGDAELFEQPQEMIRGPANGNSSETLRVGQLFIGKQLLRGQGKQEAQMLPGGRQVPALDGKKGAQIGRRNKFEPERGKARLEHPAFERFSVAASGYNNQGAAFAAPGHGGGLRQPGCGRAQPRCLRRCGKKQAVAGPRVEFQF